MSSSKSCSFCGSQNPTDADLCRHCRRPLDDQDPLIGKEVLGGYRIEGVLGRGGMSVVYRACHAVTEQTVAIKVLPPELANHPEVKARFISEARTLAKIEHPNIVAMHNLVQEENQLFLVMQLAEGASFDRVIAQQGKVCPADAVAIGIEVLRALEYAHTRGIVHRDIKPSNIVIRGDSSIKVMDFGIAKIVGGTRLTETGQTMGTVRYMSPEQVRGQSVDHRADLYALGITLYEAICGRAPFEGEGYFEIMRAHLSDPPTPASQLVLCPAALNDVLLRALRKRPADRFQSAAEFRLALRAVPIDPDQRVLTRSVPLPPLEDSSSGSLPAPIASASQGRRLPLLLAVGVLLVAAGLLLWFGVVGQTSSRGSGVHTSSSPDAGAAALPPLHRVARAQAWRVDRRFSEISLRVLAIKQVDAEFVARRYRRCRAGYRDYLAGQGLVFDFRIGPLNLALVPQTLLNDRRHWPDARADVDYPTRYVAPSAALYVQDGPGGLDRDLYYGLALHFCARIPDRKLSNERCYQLAEGFESFIKQADVSELGRG